MEIPLCVKLPLAIVSTIMLIYYGKVAIEEGIKKEKRYGK